MHDSSRRAGRRAAPGTTDSQRIAALLEPVVRALGMDLEGVRLTSAGRRRLLRVVVDADGGVSLDEIALASRKLSARLDNAGAMGEAPYTLEVSSPGVDRPLTEPRHWRRAAGRLVKVPVSTPGADRAQPVTGRVIAADEHGVTMEVAGGNRQFGYPELGPGRMVIEFAPAGAGETAVAGGREDEEEAGGY
jgi:ribosome maturation factor RimP